MSSKVRVTASEIGGGFGGKTVVYLEPLALALSKKAGAPVKMVMTREEVFRATGPTSGAHVRVKIGAKKDGRIVAAEAELKYQAGAFAGSPVQPGCHVRLRALRPREREGRGLRRRHQPAEGRGLSRARRPDLGVRGRERDRRDRRQDRHGPDRAASQERRQAGHQGRLRAEVRPDRHDRDAGGGQGARALAHAARARTRAAASPRASGSTSAARRRCRCRSTRTARCR